MKKTLLFLCTVFLIQSFFPLLTYAKDTIPPIPVSDSSLRDKEVGLTIGGFTLYGITLDSIIIVAVKAAIDELFDTMTNWVNTGFQGSPAFATDLNGYLQHLGDIAAGAAISNITNGFVCQPFRLEIQAALSRDFGRTTNRYNPNMCTWSQIQGNMEQFLGGNFNSGGWPAWFQLTQNDANNPYGSYLQAKGAVSASIQGARDIELSKLGWSGGFIGTKDCVKYVQEQTYDTDPETNETIITTQNSSTCEQWGPEKTPGRVIADQVSKVFGSGVDQLNLANDFDQLFSAVVNQLGQKVFSRSGIFSGGRIAGTVNYGSTGAGSRGACTVSSNRAVVGERVTWSAVAVVPGSDITYQWSGTEVGDITSTSTDRTVVYGNSGEKRMNITVSSYQSDYLRDPDPITGAYPKKQVLNNLSCTEIVTVSQFSPLTITACSVTPTRIQGQGTAAWSATIVGGSGRINLVRWFGDDTGKYDGGDFHYNTGPFAAAPGSSPSSITVTATKDYYWLKGSGADSCAGGLSSSNCSYENVARPGYKSAQISIVDADSTVAPLDKVSCPAQVYIYH